MMKTCLQDGIWDYDEDMPPRQYLRRWWRHASKTVSETMMRTCLQDSIWDYDEDMPPRQYLRLWWRHAFSTLSETIMRACLQDIIWDYDEDMLSRLSADNYYYLFIFRLDYWVIKSNKSNRITRFNKILLLCNSLQNSLYMETSC